MNNTYKNNNNFSCSWKLRLQKAGKRRGLKSMLGLASVALGTFTMSTSTASADVWIGDGMTRADVIHTSRAAHFLSQATMGATAAQVNALADRMAAIGNIQACNEWITNQFNVPTGRNLSTASLRASGNDSDGRSSTGRGNSWVYTGWLDNALNSNDQLRMRMSWALSQIFVVGDSYWQNLEHRAGRYRVHADYIDTLEQNAFGTYRNCLRAVTYHPFMGVTLSHNSNGRARFTANGNLISQPDQNFAREIMQLFSMGVFRQNAFGDFVLDNNGVPIENYDEEDIQTMSRVFTGLAIDDNRGFNNKSATLIGTRPMRLYPAYHDNGRKVLPTGQVLPQGNGGNADINQTLTMCQNHPSTAPYFCQLLIKRFTSSNPSRAYIRRVVDAWRGEGPYGTGNIGSFRAVLRAILLDEEVRRAIRYPANGNNYVNTVPFHLIGGNQNGLSGNSVQGKIKDPALRTSQYLRFMGTTTRSDNRTHLNPSVQGPDNRVCNSATVFNFYSEAFAPADGRIGNFVAAWRRHRNQEIEVLAPEMQIVAESVIGDYERYYQLARFQNTTGQNQNFVPILNRANFYLDTPRFRDPRVLVRDLNLYLCAGTMPRRVRDGIISNLDNLDANNRLARRTAIEHAIALTLSSPSYYFSY